MENLFIIRLEIITFFLSLGFMCYYLFGKMSSTYKKVKEHIVPLDEENKIRNTQVTVTEKKETYKKPQKRLSEEKK